MDHELAYLRLRDHDPDLIAALMDPGVMEIPANTVENRVVRAAGTGPVFFLDGSDGSLGMRYSARPRNVIWRSDALTQRALTVLRELMADGDDAHQFKLEAGQGLFCNNVLHGRHAYTDSEQQPARAMWRARFLDRIAVPATPNR